MPDWVYCRKNTFAFKAVCNFICLIEVKGQFRPVETAVGPEPVPTLFPEFSLLLCFPVSTP